MMNKRLHFLGALLALFGLSAQAQVTFRAVAEDNRYDDGDQMTSKYLGWNDELQKAIFVVDNGLYAMTWDETKLSTPAKSPEVKIADFYSGGKYTDNEKASWANDFNLMAGNSGAVYVNGTVWTIFSRDEQSTTDEELFAVRKWDAKTGNLLSGRSDYYPKSACLESAGMAYNPVDGKVYGLFYLTEQELASEITDDPDFFTDTDGEASAMDAGYCICTIDLETMTVKPVTPGLYYYNFVTFAINSEGRAFALTSGGTSGTPNDDGKMTGINGNLTGAQLCEFNLENGLMKMVAKTVVDPETNEEYTEYEHPIGATGYCSQYRRQSACFAKSNPNKMYWNGFVNSGKGVNSYGSWSSLDDREWRTNEKYDTALYEVDINTGEATRLTKIKNRWRFSAMWVDGDDVSDGTTGIVNAATAMDSPATGVYNLQGQYVGAEMPQQAGIYVSNSRKVVVK